MKNFKTGDIDYQIAFQGYSTYSYYHSYCWIPISIPSLVFSFSNPCTFECFKYLIVVNCIYVIASKLEIFSCLLLTYFFSYILIYWLIFFSYIPIYFSYIFFSYIFSHIFFSYIYLSVHLHYFKNQFIWTLYRLYNYF